MEAALFAKSYQAEQAEFICFKWNGKRANEFIDNNLAFRREVITYIEANQYEGVCGILLRDLLVAEAQYSKEAWGIYRNYPALAESLIKSTGTVYLDDFLKAAFMCFDTYCATLCIDFSTVEYETCHQELIARQATAAEGMREVYEKGIELFFKYTTRQSNPLPEAETCVVKLTFIERELREGCLKNNICSIKSISHLSANLYSSNFHFCEIIFMCEADY
ncbi:hypothetical protein [Paenibacillus whitsoniae]|uniref:Uncharacterized protein n=1 Tax=Paenibacillus whitsoniae TaxID=2496558 RepID=A0A430J5P3_9BACL|nr:hypothetical protein [Paenibacillus whitsoniae]RTE02655.1 hypothetical protein EJQ19_29080 [Paenibacillus whitsoniae]